MTEPTEYPYHGMSEGFAGDWVDESTPDGPATSASAAPEPAAAPPTPPVAPPPPPPAPPVVPPAVAPHGEAPPPPPPAPPTATSVRRGPVMPPLFSEPPALHAPLASANLEPQDYEHAAESGSAVGDKLSALLQVAVDEQVHEQRQLVQLMNEIRSGMASGGGQSVDTDQLRGVVENAVGSAVAQLSDNFKVGMQTLREQHDAQIADLSQRLMDAQGELRALREYATEASNEPDPGGPSVEDLLDGMAGMRTELRVLPEQFAPFVAQALAPSVADLGRTISALEESQDASTRDIAVMHAELSALLPRLERVPDQLAVLGSQMSSLSAAQAALASAPAVHAGPDAHEIADIVRKGVRDATRDFVRDYLRDAVRDIVTVSTRDTERRITDHVDEAILALAQALLTRRPAVTHVAAAPAPVAPPQAAPPQAAPAPPTSWMTPLETPRPSVIDGESARTPAPDPLTDAIPPVEPEPPLTPEPLLEPEPPMEPERPVEPEPLAPPVADASPAAPVAESPVAPPVAPPVEGFDEVPVGGLDAPDPGGTSTPVTPRRRGLFRRR